MVSPFILLLGKRVELRSAKISLFNIISVQELTMRDGSRIGKFNRIIGVHKVELDKSSFILQGNFIGGTWGTLLQNGIEDLFLGERSQITIGAFIDLNDQVVFGKDVVAGGVGTQFWTHGFNHNRDRISGPIKISDRVFLGSATIVMPNVSICSEVTIGAGTNVHRSITEPGLYLSSELIKKT
jgi:acetyltransferase-like isoleucine patch superfamily enzyme